MQRRGHGWKNSTGGVGRGDLRGPFLWMREEAGWLCPDSVGPFARSCGCLAMMGQMSWPGRAGLSILITCFLCRNAARDSGPVSMRESEVVDGDSAVESGGGTSDVQEGWRPGIVYKSYFARGGGVWVGGSSAGWVGLKLWTPTPLIIPRVSWVGLLPHLLSLVTGALSGCLLVPFSALSLCRWQVCRWQFFRWGTFFLITS